jgi:ABC-type sugar transport system permease subunit
MKTLLFFLLVILAFFVLPSLFGSILADRKSKGKDYLNKILIPLGYVSFVLLAVLVGLAVHYSGGYLNHTVLSFNEGIFLPFSISSGSSLMMVLFYRIKFISEKRKEKELFSLVLPSLILFLISLISIYELILY